MNHYCLRAYPILRLSNLKGPPPRLLVRLYRILGSTDGLTMTNIVKRTGMSTRQPTGG
jgi:hypothetical protein